MVDAGPEWVIRFDEVLQHVETHAGCTLVQGGDAVDHEWYLAAHGTLLERARAVSAGGIVVALTVRPPEGEKPASVTDEFASQRRTERDARAEHRSAPRFARHRDDHLSHKASRRPSPKSLPDWKLVFAASSAVEAIPMMSKVIACERRAGFLRLMAPAMMPTMPIARDEADDEQRNERAGVPLAIAVHRRCGDGPAAGSGAAPAGAQPVGAEGDDEQICPADRPEDGVPPTLSSGELLVDPDLVTRPADVLQQRVDGLTVATGIAHEDPH